MLHAMNCAGSKSEHSGLKAGLFLLAGVSFTAITGVSSAGAMTVRECHAAWESAKASGGAGIFREYSAAHCPLAHRAGKEAQSLEKSAKEDAEAVRGKAVEEKDRAEKSGKAVLDRARSASPLAALTNSGAVFPSAISSEFSSLPAARARLKTCAAQYDANKAVNKNGGLKWIQKGGGYWSQCNARLKGE